MRQNDWPEVADVARLSTFVRRDEGAAKTGGGERGRARDCFADGDGEGTEGDGHRAGGATRVFILDKTHQGEAYDSIASHAA